MIPVNKNGKRDWFVFGEVKSFSHKKSSTLSTILAIYVQGHSVCARSLGPLTNCSAMALAYMVGQLGSWEEGFS